MDSLPDVQPDVPASVATATDTTLVNVICPSCGAELKNVRAQAGVKIRCLNCNTKFLPPAAGAPAGSAPGAAPATSLRQEPRTPGYWLLRIPAIIGCGAAFFIMALTLYSFASSSGYSSAIGNLLQLSYIPLIGCAGLVPYLLTRSLARVDSGGVLTAWRAGMVTGPLPSPEGSSLPYIAPLALIGGLLPVLVIVSGGGEDMGGVVAAALFGAGIFYAGIALEDVRQFIWRQETLAQECCRAAGVDQRAFMAGGVYRIPAGTVLAAAFVAAGLSFLALAFAYRSSSWRSSQTTILAFNGLSMLAASVSIYKLGQGWDRAVALWQHLGGEARNRDAAGFPLKTSVILLTCVVFCVFGPAAWGGNPPEVLLLLTLLVLPVFSYKLVRCFWPQSLSGARLWVAAAPLVWTGWGLVWLLILYNKEGRSQNGMDFASQVLAFTAGGALAVSLSLLISQFFIWRQGQENFWRAQNAAGSRFNPPSRWEAVFCRGVFWLSLAEAVAFVAMILSQVGLGSWNAVGVIGFPLGVAMLHYPAVWFATLLLEFLALESLYSAGKPDSIDEQ